MRRLQARGDVPVDVADVVVVLVFAQVRQVEPGAAHQRAVVALQQAVEPADDRPFEPAQRALGPLGRGVCGVVVAAASPPLRNQVFMRRFARHQATSFSCSSGLAGAGTARMILSIRPSGVSPSDRPS